MEAGASDGAVAIEGEAAGGVTVAVAVDAPVILSHALLEGRLDLADMIRRPELADLSGTGN